MNCSGQKWYLLHLKIMGFFFRENPLDLNSMSTKQHWLNELLGFQTLNLSITSKPSTLTHLNLNIYKGSNPILFCINYIHTFIFPVKSAIPVQFWSIQSEFYDPSSTFSFSNILPLIAKKVDCKGILSASLFNST